MTSKNLTVEQSEQAKDYERIERLITLKAGEYWRAIKDDLHESIEKGHVLLLVNIDHIDNKPHTIYIRLHPSKIRRYVSSDVKFLVADFLAGFEHVHITEAKSIRQREIAGTQEQISTAQAELSYLAADFDLLDREIARRETGEDDDMADVAADSFTTEEKENKAVSVFDNAVDNTVLQAMQTQSVSTFMSRDLTGEKLKLSKVALTKQQQIAVKRAKFLKENTERVTAMTSRLLPYYEEQTAVALAKTSDAQKAIKSLTQGIDSLRLYCLENVDIITVQKGESAPPDCPLTVGQRVLFMDEEIAVWADIEEKFDCRSKKFFFETLLSDQRFIDQIFPGDRCVVGLASSRQVFDYFRDGFDKYAACQLDMENKRVYLLIRDGENIHYVLSPELWHQGLRQLFPSKNEIDRIFTGFAGERITYNDINYTEKMAYHDLVALCYKRLLILLAGLDHHKRLFGTFYEGEPSLGFISLAFQEQHFRFIHDDDGKGMFGTPPRQPLYQWVTELNKEIGVGSTVLCVWRLVANRRSIPSAYQRWNQYMRDERDQSLQYRPKKSDFIGVVKLDKGKRYIEVPVKGETLKWDEREFNAKLYLDHIGNHRDEPGMLCLDRFEPEDAYSYINHRPSRVDVENILLLKRAARFVEKRNKSEEKIRTALLSHISVVDLASEDDAGKLVNAALAKWRCANPGKDPTTELSNTKKLNKVLDQIYWLADDSKSHVVAVRAAETSKGRSALRVSLLADGRYVAYSTPRQQDRDDRLEPFAWVDRVVYQVSRRGMTAKSRRFVSLKEFNNAETLLYEADNIKDWVDIPKSPFKSPKHKQEALAFDDMDPAGWLEKVRAAKENDRDFYRLLDLYVIKRQYFSRKGGSVVAPIFIIPIGAVYYLNKQNKKGWFYELALSASGAYVLAYLANGNQERERRFIDEYISIYAYKSENREVARRLLREAKNETLSSILRVGPVVPKLNDGIFSPGVHSYFSLVPGKQYSFDAALTHIEDPDDSERSYFLHPDLAGGIDSFLGVSAPDNLRPHMVYKKRYFGEWSSHLFVLDDDVYKTLEECTNNFERTIDVFDTLEAAESSIKLEQVHSRTDGKVSLVSYQPKEVESSMIEGFQALRSWVFNKVETNENATENG